MSPPALRSRAYDAHCIRHTVMIEGSFVAALFLAKYLNLLLLDPLVNVICILSRPLIRMMSLNGSGHDFSIREPK